MLFSFRQRRVGVLTIDDISFRFNSREELRKQIVERLSEVERRATARKIDRAHVEAICDHVASSPHGVIRTDGGHVSKSYRYSAKTSHLMVAWLTYRGEKLVVVEASREWAQKVPYGSVAKMKHETNRLSAFSKFFPARAAKITNYLSSRKCRPAIAHLPKPPVRVVDVIPDVGGIVLAWSSDTHGWYVGTPSGWIKLNSWIPHSAWMALRNLGFPVPHKRDKRKWDEKMEAHMIMLKLAQ
jgi:hypothetical protein